MDADTLMFFEQQPDALPLYEAFSEAVLKRYPDTKIKVQKTQITFTNRHIFACASFLRVRKKERTAESISGNHTGVVLPIGIAPRSGQNGALSRTVDNPHCD